MDLVAARGEDGADFEDGGCGESCEFLGVVDLHGGLRGEGWEHGVELDAPA